MILRKIESLGYFPFYIAIFPTCWHNFCNLFDMNRLIYIFLYWMFVCLSISAQSNHNPKRTPIDVAYKQTEMLVRELNITDSLLRDQLFNIHFKYALLHSESNTRADILHMMQQIINNLQNILTPEQFTHFMNSRVNHLPRFTQSSHNRINLFSSEDSLSSPTSTKAHTPSVPQESQP